MTFDDEITSARRIAVTAIYLHYTSLVLYEAGALDEHPGDNGREPHESQ